MEDLAQRIHRIKAQHRYRHLQTREGAQGARVQMNGKRYLNFCSNDYLGLSNHPEINQALLQAVQRYGVGSGAAHLINGHTSAHAELEEALARFTGRQKALLFSCGYMANLGVVNVLLGAGDAVFEDRLNHASLIDAGLSSRARFRRYAHLDVSALSAQLQQSSAAQKMIVTDGVFSMDGDIAPVAALAEVAQQHHAWLMVDDAHGLGVLGAHGGGVLEAQGVSMAAVPILMGTLGKAFGVSGAFVAGAATLIDVLMQQARTYIYTTAMPPALAAAACKSVQLAQEESWRRQHVMTLIALFTEKMRDLGRPATAPCAIQPIMIGSEQNALRASQQLAEQGILVTAIRPPTVPEGAARLRITLSAFHTEADVAQLVAALAMLPSVTKP